MSRKKPMSDNSKKISKHRDSFLARLKLDRHEVFKGKYDFKLYAKHIALADIPLEEDAPKEETPAEKQLRLHRRNARIAANILIDEDCCYVVDSDSFEDVEKIRMDFPVEALNSLTEGVQKATGDKDAPN